MQRSFTCCLPSLRRASALVALAGGLTAHAFAQVPTKPNIVMFMPDDLDRTTLNTAVANGLMPNLQKYIINPGTTFTNYYVSDSRGCPTRLGYLTGQYFHNLVPEGSTHECSVGASSGVPAFNDQSTIATWLKAGSNYQTSFIGKYIDGYGYTDVNGDGVVNKADATYIPPGWDNWQVFSYYFPVLAGNIPAYILPQDNPNEYEYFINNNGKLKYYGMAASDYQADVLTQIAVKYIGKVKTSEPFYLVLAPGAPHIETNYAQTPLLPGYEQGWSWDVRPAPKYVGTVNLPLAEPLNFNQPDVSTMPQWVQTKAVLSASPDITDLTVQWNDRLASLRDVDDMIGSVVAAMQANGTYTNSILFFTSDNGWFYANHRLTGKLAAYEESIGVPFFSSVGGGVSTNAMIMSNDWAPTIAQLAGVTPPSSVDGTSIVPLLTNPSQPWRNRYLAEHWQALGGAEAIFDMPNYLALRTAITNPVLPNQLYVQYTTQELELYNCVVDPYEITNLAVTDPNDLGGVIQNDNAYVQMLSTCKGAACHTAEFQ